MKQLAIRLSWQTTPAKSLVMSECEARVPQPPDRLSNAGNPEGAANRGGVSLAIFFGSTKKVAGVRGRTPRFYFLMLGIALLNPTYFPPVSFTSALAHPFANVTLNSSPTASVAASDTTRPCASCTMLYPRASTCFGSRYTRCCAMFSSREAWRCCAVRIALVRRCARLSCRS